MNPGVHNLTGVCERSSKIYCVKHSLYSGWMQAPRGDGIFKVFFQTQFLLESAHDRIVSKLSLYVHNSNFYLHFILLTMYINSMCIGCWNFLFFVPKLLFMRENCRMFLFKVHPIMLTTFFHHFGKYEFHCGKMSFIFEVNHESNRF